MKALIGAQPLMRDRASLNVTCSEEQVLVATTSMQGMQDGGWRSAASTPCLHGTAGGCAGTCIGHCRAANGNEAARCEYILMHPTWTVNHGGGMGCSSFMSPGPFLRSMGMWRSCQTQNAWFSHTFMIAAMLIPPPGRCSRARVQAAPSSGRPGRFAMGDATLARVFGQMTVKEH